MSDPMSDPFTHVTPTMRIAHTDGDQRLLIFGDTVAPTYKRTTTKPEALRLGAALVASAMDTPMYSRETIEAILRGAAMIVPPSRIRVTVADEDGGVYEATAYEVDVYGKADTVTIALTSSDENMAGTLVDVHPMQILHMRVQRP